MSAHQVSSDEPRKSPLGTRRKCHRRLSRFYNFYFFLYLFAPKVAHRVVGYFEEEAVTSYTQYLDEIDTGRHENVPAPQIAIEYWGLEADARPGT